MLNLLTKLTPLDNKRIENYISEWGIEDNYIGNAEWLKPWADSKKKLYHLLGGNLIVKNEFTYEKPKDEIDKEISNLYWKYENFLGKLAKEVANSLGYEGVYAAYEAGTDNALFDAIYTKKAFCSGVLQHSYKTTFKNGKLFRLEKGEKTIRAIQKVIKYFELHEFEEKYEKLRNDLSIVTNERIIKGNLCLSIHPLDFMTMSDNALSYSDGWSSCMAWVKKDGENSGGCYHGGTVEMMNSNMVICVYMDSKNDFIFTKDEEKKKDESYHWNKKKWRQLFYINKDIIVGGKSYPYENKIVSEYVLNKIREMAKENLHWTYKFGPEPYRDMIHTGTMYRMDANRRWANKSSMMKNSFSKPIKHNIIFNTKAMYNDFFNDYNREYICVRNKVDRNKFITVSGKHPCLCCGDDVSYETDDYDYYSEDAYNSRYEGHRFTICHKCRADRSCSICNSGGKNNDGYEKCFIINGKQVCADCLEGMFRKCPDCGKYFNYGKIRFGNKIAYSTKNLTFCNTTEIDNMCYDYQKNVYTGKFGRIITCPECRVKFLNDGLVKVPAYVNDYPNGHWMSSARIDRPGYILAKSYEHNDPWILKHLPPNIEHLDTSTFKKGINIKLDIDF